MNSDAVSDLPFTTLKKVQVFSIDFRSWDVKVAVK